MDAIKQIYEIGLDLATNTKHTKWLSPALLGLDALLTGLIIWKVPCMFAHPLSSFPHLSCSLPLSQECLKLLGTDTRT